MPNFEPASNSAEFIVVEEGAYTVTCTSIEDYEHSQYGSGLRWQFTIDRAAHPDAVTEKGDSLILSAISDTRLVKGVKTRKWVEVLLGRELDEGEVPDLVELIGKKVRAMVKITKKPDGREFNKVDSLAPLATGTVRRAPATTGKF